MASPLDKLYADLTAATGITRVRDVRLEKIAMDRALEARYTVGTDGDMGIPHPIQQLMARCFPLQDATASVHENAFWGYGPDSEWVDVTNAWMSSPAHRDNLLRATDKHWGLGYHREPPNTAAGQTFDRHYYILILTEPLWPLTLRRFTVKPGTYTGLQLTAKGEVIAERPATFARESGALWDVRRDLPNRGPYLHVVNGTWKDYWVPESSDLQPNPL